MRVGISKGFTLVELIIVIVVLGILSAVALPRLLSVQDDAKASVIKGIANNLQKIADVTNGKAILEGVNASATATITDDRGNIISLAYGYPIHDWGSAFQYLTRMNATSMNTDASCTNDFCVEEDYDISATVAETAANVAFIVYPRSTSRAGNCYAYYIYDQSSAANEPAIGTVTTGC